LALLLKQNQAEAFQIVSLANRNKLNPTTALPYYYFLSMMSMGLQVAVLVDYSVKLALVHGSKLILKARPS
jgi:hypothetical protein